MLLKNMSSRMDNNGRESRRVCEWGSEWPGWARGHLQRASSARHSHTHHYFKAKHQVAHKYGTVRPFARVPFTPKSTYHPRYCSSDRHLNRVNKSLKALSNKQRKK